MLFNSFEFLAFLLIVLVLFYGIPSKFRWVVLLISSYFFYMYWNPMYIVLILVSTVIDYHVSHRIYKEERDNKRRKGLLILSLISNLGLLFVFKYFNFFLESSTSLVQLLDPSFQGSRLNLLLPVGISFYTFQTMSYTIDVYRGVLKPESHFGKFALYVSFFPQLVAGPIERATNLLPQFDDLSTKLKYSNFSIGFTRIIYGLFKKVVVADTAALYVDAMYNNAEYQSGFTLLCATYFFAIQIYCDFSGYSDIAIGTARLFGFKFMENFNTPYFSKSITEFWRRWHISLSSWLRDYLYISLGGNRLGMILTYRNLMITMLLGGLWHGASWNFVVWGALNGLYLAIERYFNWDKRVAQSGFFSSGLTRLLTFNLTCLAWVFFRIDTFDNAIAILFDIITFKNGLQFNFGDQNVFSNILIGITIMLIVDFFYLRKTSFDELVSKQKTYTNVAFNTFFILVIIAMGISGSGQFIYFQF